MTDDEKQVKDSLKSLSLLLISMGENIKTAEKRGFGPTWRTLGQCLAESSAAISIHVHVAVEQFPELLLTDIQYVADQLVRSEMGKLAYYSGVVRGTPFSGPTTRQ